MYDLQASYTAGSAVPVAATAWSCPGLNIGSFMATHYDTSIYSGVNELVRFDASTCSTTVKRPFEDANALRLSYPYTYDRQRVRYAYAHGIEANNGNEGAITVENVAGGQGANAQTVVRAFSEGFIEIDDLAFNAAGTKLAALEEYQPTAGDRTIRIVMWDVNPTTNALTNETVVIAETGGSYYSQNGRLFQFTDSGAIVYTMGEVSGYKELVRRVDLSTGVATTILADHYQLPKAPGQTVNAWRALGVVGGKLLFLGGDDLTGIWSIPETGASAANANQPVLIQSDYDMSIEDSSIVISPDGSRAIVPVRSKYNHLTQLQSVNLATGAVSTVSTASPNAQRIDNLVFSTNSNYVVGDCQQGSSNGYSRTNICAFNLTTPGAPIMLTDTAPVAFNGYYIQTGPTMLRPGRL
jgi:hypothetical protein